jgi:hypothetical protein
VTTTGKQGGTTLNPHQATRIKIFPAVPRSWSNVVFNKLRAEGAFVVRLSRLF